MAKSPLESPRGQTAILLQVYRRFTNCEYGGADGTTLELLSERAVAQFIADFRTWCLTEEAAKLARQLPAVALSA